MGGANKFAAGGGEDRGGGNYCFKNGEIQILRQYEKLVDLPYSQILHCVSHHCHDHMKQFHYSLEPICKDGHAVRIEFTTKSLKSLFRAMLCFGG